ncbi:photosystem II 5 kDa protein, chloroplastic-like [Tasmannia lanceolata]|uniref:photosystem II 5 kDa protein, chloroplastic-like n=1 Tax=Tasmannia lanceolata TaxID=3420 RepID=UPI0040635650
MTTPFSGGVNISGRSPVSRRWLVMAKAVEAGAKETSNKNTNINGRRDMIFAAATAAICSVASGHGVATAGDLDAKRGTLEAKKAYAPVCVTMPTARICHK